MTTDPGEQAFIEGLWQVVTRRVTERATAAVELLETLMLTIGRVRRKDNELWVGERLLNDDRELLPRVSRAASLGVAVHLGNRRIASFSMLDAGPPLEVGGFADAALVDVVLRRRQSFRGTLDIGGRRVLVCARPFYASGRIEEHGPLGLVEAYQDEETFRELLAGGWRRARGDAPQSPLVRAAEHIDELRRFIDDVARRLQLLALNGNIIAAQAGDHGRAFRVVCRELAALAEQAKDSLGLAQEVAGALAPVTAASGPE